MKAIASLFFLAASAETLVAAPSAHPDFLKKLRDPAHYVVNRHPAELESICGQDDLQPINDYDGEAGQPQTFARLHQLPVGAMTSTTTSDDDKYCSGTLIGPDLFITAGHCIDAQTVGQFIAMNYERAAGSTDVLAQDFYKISEVVEEGGAFDYAIVRLDDFPGFKYGWAMVRTSQAEVGETITIIQHPSGGPKKIEVGHVAGYDGNYLTYGDLDTEPGSSGSGIVDSLGYLVGVHTNGGCTAETGTNSGTRLNAARNSPVLSRVANVNLPFQDGSMLRIAIFGGDTPHVLAGDLDDLTVVLDSVRQKTTLLRDWRVTDLADGSFRLQLVDGDRSGYLFGSAMAGTVKLIEDNIGDELFATRWRIVRTDEGRYILRTVAPGDAGRWLSGSPDSRAVILENDAREWEIVVR